MAKPKRSPVEQQVGALGQQEQKTGMANQGTAQGTLSQFEGPVNQSPFYKSLLSAGTQSTSNAYQQAKSNTAARAKAAGFGNAQPVAQGAENEIDSQEAKAQSQVPQNAMVQATGPALSAAGETANIGAAQTGAGVSYSGQQVSLEEQYQQQLAQQQQAMWKALSEAGGGLIDANPHNIFG